MSMLAGGAVLSPAAAADPEPPCGQGATSPEFNQFVDEAAQPPVAAPDGKNHYTLTAHLGSHSFQSGKPAVPTLGYSTANAAMDYLGPTIVTKKGTPVDVKIVNALPAAGTPMFPFDQPNNDNAVVVHRHGGLQTVANDGTPSQLVAPGASRTNHYPNNQAAAPLWYHDHADMTTSYSVYEGLAGFMPNTDNIEPKFNLPSGDFSRAYVLQDKSFNSDYSLCYTHASPEFFGDTPVVFGTISPKQTVEPRLYTFTFINGSDSRFYHLTLKPATATSGATGTSDKAPKMTVVGSDSGYLYKPAKVNDLLIAPGERYKVVVDFTHRTGSWVLSNDAATPYPAGDPSVAAIPQIMRFDVGSKVTSKDKSSIPDKLKETNNDQPAVSFLDRARLRTVQAAEPADMPGMPLLGNSTSLLQFTDPPTETPQLGSTEAWAMRNHSPDAHPIHEHLVEMYLIGRWQVTQWSEQDATGSAVPLAVGAFQPAGAYESGPKDTFVSPPDTITVWVAKYTIGTDGVSVWHCHILSHEDNAMAPMMRPLAVGTTPQTQLPKVGSFKKLDALIRQP